MRRHGSHQIHPARVSVERHLGAWNTFWHERTDYKAQKAMIAAQERVAIARIKGDIDLERYRMSAALDLETARIKGVVAIHEAQVRERMNVDDNATARYVAHAALGIATARTVCEAIRTYGCIEIAEFNQTRALMDHLQQTRSVLLALVHRDDLSSDQRKSIVPELQRLRDAEDGLGLMIARTFARRHGDFPVGLLED